MTILHGDNESAIHVRLQQLLDDARTKNNPISRLDGKKVTLDAIQQALQTDALFATEKLVIVTGLLVGQASERKKQIVAYLRDQQSSDVEVVLVELKALSVTQLKPFIGVKTELFKYPVILFQWLEGIGVVPLASILKQYHQLLEREAPELLLTMLVRQIRMLLAYKSDGTVLGAPFLAGKLSRQTKPFTLEKLLDIHAALLRIDEQQKTSQSPLTLGQQLDLLLCQAYVRKS